jgi:hypothetical protein
MVEHSTGIPGKFGHVGKARNRGLLAAPEFAKLAIDKEGYEFQMEGSGGKVALHDPGLSLRSGGKAIAFRPGSVFRA